MHDNLTVRYHDTNHVLFCRSLDGIKFRPLQRSDPSGRRRSFKKRHSSSSTSSKDSRASRDEELKMFTSLEEAELSTNTPAQGEPNFGSAPNLSARSYSRSRSRTPKNDNWSVDASGDSTGERADEAKKLDSFDEEAKEEVNDDDEDFWGNSGD
ncbi:Uncharacterized protein OBRU01_08921 [Operophtera brumata]|uniref:Uncharacterized protein n=1 Tax=Operophtera brumata TaxID=104452 RepID=A0A0L7LAG1_OPEBR|nr:Uncharacterized protein OBRU01_08921 [Operophtera brumata]